MMREHRDPRLAPKPGDVIQVIPVITDMPTPGPMTVIEVTDRAVRWQRDGEPHETSLHFWKTSRQIARAQVIEAAP